MKLREKCLLPWCLPSTPTIEESDQPSVTLVLFSPANYYKTEQKDVVGEESSVSLELSLSCGYTSSSTGKGKEVKQSSQVGESDSYDHVRKLNCGEKESYGLSLELSLSGEHTSMLKGKSVLVDEGKQKRFEIGECSYRYQREENEVGGLSLELSLGFNDSTTTCTSNKRKRMATDRIVSSCRNKKINVEKGEASRSSVSAESRLGHDPWRIKKTLTGSDLGNMSRLLLSSELVESHVLRFWNEDQLAKIKEGLLVSVWDSDTHTEHELVFMQWNNGANVLKKNWVKGFVKRRELKVGDEIGLYWDRCNSRFQFSVLNRVARN